jgi:hypothetical protein
MMNLTGNLEAAAAAGRAGVGAAAAATARRATGVAGEHQFEAPMAAAVRHELFTEALLASAHARLEELKTASMNGGK